MTTTASAAWLAALLSLGVAACSDSNDTAASSNATPPPATIAEAINQAEKNGDVPVLNRDSTLAGVDADGNGIRDDIDAYINKLPDTETQKQALRQAARATQKILLLNLNDQQAVLAASQEETFSVKCMLARYPSNDANSRSEEIEKFTVNTRERLKAYTDYAAALSGKVLSLPQGDNCAV